MLLGKIEKLGLPTLIAIGNMLHIAERPFILSLELSDGLNPNFQSLITAFYFSSVAKPMTSLSLVHKKFALS